MGNFRRFAPIFMPIAVVGIIMGVFFSFNKASAILPPIVAVSSDGNMNIRLTPSNMESGATNASWIFNVTTTEALVENDIIKFKFPAAVGTSSPFVLPAIPSSVSTFYRSPFDLLLNSSLEEWSGELPDQWESAYVGLSTTTPTTTSYDGNLASVVTSDGDGNLVFMSQAITVVTSSVYSYSATARALTDSSNLYFGFSIVGTNVWWNFVSSTFEDTGGMPGLANFYQFANVSTTAWETFLVSVTSTIGGEITPNWGIVGDASKSIIIDNLNIKKANNNGFAGDILGSNLTIYGYITSTIATGTPLTFTFTGITNASGIQSQVADLLFEVSAGTLDTLNAPISSYVVEKFSATTTLSLTTSTVEEDVGDTPAAVSNVVLADNDSTSTLGNAAGYGLDGRDFTVTWTPTSSAPAGYQSTHIYITTSGVQLTASNVTTNGCGDIAPEPRGFFNQFLGMATFTLPNFPNVDSCRQNYATSSSYVAWVFTSATASSIASSSAVSYAESFDVVPDINAPQVDHISVHTATEAATATLYAFVFDDQTNSVAFGNTGDGGAEFFKAFYGTDVSASEASVDAVAVADAGELYSFTISVGSVPAAGNTLEYYLIAQDAGGNKRFICADGTASVTSTCKASPFVINTVTAGGRTVSGKITNQEGNLSDAFVFAAGFGGAGVTTDGSGDYSIGSLPNNSGFDFSATKVGYGKASKLETIGTSNKTGVNMYLNFGSFGFFDGGGMDGGGAPRVVFSGPPDGMQGFNISESLRAGFNQPMDATSITTVSSATSSNVYLVKTATGENVAGSVTYCSNNQAAGCELLFSMDTNVILFNPTADLSTSTQYTLVITEKVKSQGGQAVEGNRSGGGHKITFTTIGDQFVDFSQISGQFGTGGQYMPPYVRSVAPSPGITAAPNIPVLVEFNDAMSASVTSSVKLYTVGGSLVAGTTASLDSNEKRFVTVSHSALSAGEYEVRVLGAASNISNVPMRTGEQAAQTAFSSRFTVSGSNDSTAPTIYPALTNNSTGVPTNKIFEFGFNEQLAFSTVSNSNVTMTRGSTAVSVSIAYDPGKNSISVVPSNVLAPNTAYTITFSPSVTDLAGNTLATTTYAYTTGGTDSTAPQLREARCDDYRCELVFNEPMVADSQSDSRWLASVLNSDNFTITSGGSTVSLSDKPLSYDPMRHAVSITGLGLTVGVTVTTTIATSTTDLSDNAVSTTVRTVVGKVEDSKITFGSFGDMGMFGPPTESFMGEGNIGSGEFKPMGFGSFTADQFSFGQADMAFPFNPTASADSNVFQIKFVPNVVLIEGDQVVLTFPNGTTITNATLDTQSPFYTDFNQFMAGTITGSGVAVDSANNKVTITLAVSGSPNASDPISVDLKKILNPSIPKDPSSGGYTVGIKVLRGGAAVTTKTSMPYFIMAGGSNTLTVNVTAGGGAAGANGTVYLHGGGPGGPMDKLLTLADGIIDKVDGTSATSVIYASLPDGCYFLGTDPYVTLGSTDYYGQMSPEPACLSGGQSSSKTINLTSASGGSTATLTVKFVNSSGDPYNFGGKDIDIFAGGPGKFVVKNLTNVTTSLSAGYQVKLNSDGYWFVGMGPGMSKSASGGKPASLGVMPPPSVNLSVSNIATTPVIALGNQFAPPGVSYSNGTVTFTFAAANKTISGTVKDVAGNGLANVEVFLHRQGFSQPVFTQTNASGTFSLNVTDYGSYEIGAHKDGMPEVMKNIELRAVGELNKIYVDGQDKTSNFVLTMKKADYTISGKVLDGNNSAIGYAPISAVSASGTSVFGMTSSDGSYTLFVDNGTWTVRAQLPPSKSDTCGSFSKSVTVSGANQSSQNITPSVSTCYTLSGNVADIANAPIFIEEWDADNNRPAPAGIRVGGSTDSAGDYSVKVGAGTYRVGSWSSTYGELSDTVTVAANTTKNLTVSNGSVIFTFTGGAADMDAFIELKNNADKNKKIAKQINGLDSATTISVPNDSATYTYFADVFGIGKFTGTILNFLEGEAEVAINLSGATLLTVTGTVYDDSGNAKSGALITFTNASSTITATTDSNGQYSAQLKAGDYSVSDSLAGYLPTKDTSVEFATSTAGYDFGTSEGGTDNDGQAALTSAPYTISGTVSSSAGVAMDEGYVWATNASGTVVTAPVNADGSYSLAVATGTWTLKGVGESHTETTNSGGAVIVSGGDEIASFVLTADASNVATSTSGILTASAGGSVNDSSGTGLKLTAGAGVLETGSGDVTLNFEKSYNAPDTANYQALGNANFSINATGDSSIKTLSGNAEIQIDYASLLADLPEGVSESDLKLAYYSPEKGDYVPVEGGFTIDTANNTITGLTSHFTDFVITYTQGSAGITVTQSDEVTAVTEGGTTDTVSYVLTSEPTANVVITPSIASQATRSPSSLTFTSGNYATPQSIIVTATDDSTVEGSHSTTITHAVTSDDSDYNGLVINDITVAITDNDSASSGGGGGSSDTTPPTNTSVVIADGATSIATTSVNLALAATGASHMMVANDSAFAGGVWTTYSTTKAWVLAVGDGVKTVYAKFRDDSGNVSNAVSDTITLISPVTTTPPPVVVSTTTQPVAVVVTPAVTIIRCKGNLNPGARGNAVKDLQAHLKELGYFTYPSNTGYYGAVTAKAVSAYQKAKGLPINGKLNTATCEKLNGSAPIVTTPAPVVSSGYKFTKYLGMGATGEEVKQLQQVLKDLGYFTYPTITGYYGAVTKAAVVKFQKAKDLKPYPGHLGPATRAALNAR